ncbi:MAG: hypothetical protein JWL95_1190 [Gemmatimonadetes bacterium]|nr:hypothetical protein [Gemmatimonadota bacterium]
MCIALATMHPSLAARAQQSGPSFHSRFLELAALRGVSDSARLHRLFALDWEYTNVESPETASFVGFPGQDDRWTDYSLAAIERRRRELPDRRLVLRAIDRRRLGPSDQLSYDIFVRGVDESIEGARFPTELLAVSQIEGPQYLSSVIAQMPASSVRDYEHILTRLSRLPALLAQVTILLDSGAACGVTPPRVTLRNVPAQLEQLVPDDAMKSALLEPFTHFPDQISPAARATLTASALSMYSDQVRPAYQRLGAYLRSSYIPRARETIARSALPDGRAWYAYDVKLQTTTSRTPSEIHQLGLSEVARIRALMDSTMRATGFTGELPAFVAMLRSDPRFFMKDSASLVRRYRDIAKRIDPELARMFGRLPRLSYGVTTVPSFAATSQPTAYYESGSPDAHRPGQFYVNTSRLEARPIWEMEALTAHEAVPGHHLQIALSQELGELPEFRRYAGYTGFVEGWGLYAESLGPELGLYRDPYSKFGQLTYEMWRAIRLVLDTGIHDMGWSRDQAVEYFRANSAKTEQEINVEVDRYIARPGQALAYKSGELEMKALRALGEKELGERFDIRAFHDELLSQGALPLDVLDARMRSWVASRKAIAMIR